jgi:hypothetical protein
MAEKQAIDDSLKAKRDEFAKSIESESLRSTEMTKQIGSVKAELTEEAKTDFASDPERKKTRDGGIKIQESSTLEYDAEKAFQFAKEKDMFLALDKKAFEKAASSLNLDFVKTVPVLKVTFPKEVKIDE